MLDLRPVRVLNRHGEQQDFTMTRAGLYLLAKFVKRADHNTYDVVCYMFENGYVQSLGANNNVWDYFKSKKGDELNRLFWSVDINFIDNVVKEFSTGKFYRKCDLFKVGRFYLLPYFKGYCSNCDVCHERYFDQTTIPYDIKRKLPTELLGYHEYCGDCAAEYYSIDRCGECGEWFDHSEMTWIDSEDYYVCEDCLGESYRQCDYCGEWFNLDRSDYCYVEESDRYYCCGTCCEDDGNEWDDYNECYVPEGSTSSVPVGGYHSHSYCPINDTKVDKRKKHKLYIGRETETDGKHYRDVRSDFYSDLDDAFNGTCFYETDGSLNEGFEIITQPMTENMFFAQNWEKPFNMLVEEGFRSHDTSTCGTHFHFSDWYLGYNDKQKVQSALKICRFFQLYAEDIKKIARRNYNHYCLDLNNFNQKIDSKTNFYELSENRYWAVNLQNMLRSRKGTIEIRICKGTLKATTMLASADFFLHIVRNAKNIAWKNINNLNLWLKGIKRQNTIDYIKARHAFVGAF